MTKDKRMPRLMIIGASWEQVPLIQKAKEMGCYVLATDSSKNAEGFIYADETATFDPRDLQTALKTAEYYQPDGITADECDYSHYAAVFISEKLGLPHDGMKSAQSTTNKLWMRQECHKMHILQPRFIGSRTIEEARNAVKIIDWPVILKPVDNRGAFGVNVATNEEELQIAFLEALMNSHSREVIVEAYIEGIHITVDGCVDNAGIHHNLAIASKKLTAGNKPIIIEVDYPAEISQEYKEHIQHVNSRVIEALDIKAGLTHSEYILDPKGRCFLVETANRGGGVYTSAKIVPAMSGVNLSKLLISNALGELYALDIQPYTGEVILKFFVFKPGKVTRIEGIDIASKLEGIEHFRLLIQVGDELNAPQSGAERHGFAILKAEDNRAIDTLYRKMMNSIQVHYE